MAAPDWISYVGMATGISGTIMGFISYRRSNSFKSLDLRLELRKSVNELYQKHSQLNDQIIYANKSRKAVAAATGNLGSGRMKLWEQQIEKDTNYLKDIQAQLPKKDEMFIGLAAEKLESKLVEVHNIQGDLSRLIEKYTSEITSDDETRRHIRDTHGG